MKGSSRAPARLVFLALAVSCGGVTTEPNHVSVDTRFSLPKGLLDRAAKITLAVIEGSVACDPATGAVTFPNGAEAARELQKKDLGKDNCENGATYCGNFSIDKSEAMRVFDAKAKLGDDTVIAIGCASAKIDQDQVPIAIKMLRYVEAANCGDGVIQPTEQCEGGGPTCDDQCQSKEQLVSTGSGQNGTSTGDPGTKNDPFFLWPRSSGNAGRFFAFFTDRALTNNNVEIGVRALSDNLGALTTPPALAAGFIYLPNGGAFPPTPEQRQQSVPQAASLSNRTYVVYQDDNTAGSNGLDIRMRSFDASLGADGPTAKTVNGTGATPAGEAAIQQNPAVVAGKDRLFIAWEDGSGKIVGRTYAAAGTFGNQTDLSTGTGNTKVSLAQTASGFVAVWQSAMGVKLRALDEAGTPQGGEQIVSEGSTAIDRPRVASLADGRFAVAWTAGGDVFVQRYDTRGSKVPGDQSKPINDVVVDGNQTQAAIGATTAVGGSFVVAWVDEGTGHVHARNLGGSAGFLFNNVNGQASEYVASRNDGRTRKSPAVVSGGSGPFVAIGWEDTTKGSKEAGITVRRFPLPAE